MKPSLHPTYYEDAVVTCTCGNTFTTGSTKKEIKVEICSACHPFFTGEMKFVDTMGRVEKFQKRQQFAAALKKQKKVKKLVAKKVEERPETLREMMLREKKKLSERQTASRKSSPQKN